MSPIAAMVAKMLSANIPAEIIVMAVETAEAAAIKTTTSSANLIEKRDKLRQYDRDRKAKKAAENKGNSASGENSSLLTSSTEAIDNKDSRKKERKESGSITVPAEIPTEKPTKRQKGTRLPNDWKPSEHHYAVGLAEYGMDRSAVDRCGQAMRDWTIREAHRAVTLKANWDLTFTSVWLKPKDHKNGHRSSNGARQSNGADFFAGLATVAADIDGDRGVDRNADAPIPGGRVNIEH